MTAALLDTHSWAWTFAGDSRVMARVAKLVADVEVHVSPISIFEIGQKVRIGKWPEMEPFLGDLAVSVGARNGSFAAFTPAVSLTAATLDWDHRDPFDRFIAATAIEHGLHLISADEHFDRLAGVRGWMGRVW